MCFLVTGCIVGGIDQLDYPLAFPPPINAARETSSAIVKSDAVKAVLTDAPEVPPPLTRRVPTTVIVELEIKEAVLPMADGVEYTFWTFGGRVPGKFMRVRQGDTIEFHLMNHPDNRFPHNIDLHAVTGPGGGAASSNTLPGRQAQFTFTALQPGLFVYHCATAPVGEHIANGMYGLILVEPSAGLAPVDREFYIMQGEFYTVGSYHAPGHQTFDMGKAADEHPTYVFFNGSEGAVMDSHASEPRSETDSDCSSATAVQTWSPASM